MRFWIFLEKGMLFFFHNSIKKGGKMMNRNTKFGISGLDDILKGGIPSNSGIIIQGTPGTGKTTLAIQFLYEGIKTYNETGIYITFEEFPEQIYRDMLNYNWDLEKLEDEEKLKIIFMTPDMLVTQLKEEQSLLHRLIQSMKCKRLIVDSISMLKYLQNDEKKQRDLFYLLKNSLKRLNITTLFIREQEKTNADTFYFEDFICDGIIKLTFDAKNETRTRMLEVIKMRGVCFEEGEHILRLTNQGIHIIPSFREPSCSIFSKSPILSTGIARIDELNNGGFQDGTNILMETDSLVRHRSIFFPIVKHQLEAGKKLLITLPITLSYEEMEYKLSHYGVDFKEKIKERKIFFLEYTDHMMPDFLKDNIICLKKDRSSTLELLENHLQTILSDPTHSWFIFLDINLMLSSVGEELFLRKYPFMISNLKFANVSILSTSNVNEITQETHASLRKISDATWKLWKKENYSYFQVMKNTSGHSSKVKVIEEQKKFPYIELR